MLVHSILPTLTEEPPSCFLLVFDFCQSVEKPRTVSISDGSIPTLTKKYYLPLFPTDEN